MMKLNTLVFMWASWAASPLLAQSPSFDCSRAETIVEHAICSSVRLSDLDRELSRAYKAARSGLGEAGRASLLEAQREFIRRRDTCGNDAPCLTRTMRGRIAQMSSGMATGPRFAGAWKPFSRSVEGSGRLSISPSRLSFETGSDYAMEAVDQNGEVFRIQLISGPDVISCGSEPVGYVVLWQFAPNQLVLNVIWDRGVPKGHPKGASTDRVENSCIMGIYER